MMLALNHCGPSRRADNHSLLSLYYDTRNIKLCHRRGREHGESETERGADEKREVENVTQMGFVLK